MSIQATRTTARESSLDRFLSPIPYRLIRRHDLPDIVRIVRAGWGLVDRLAAVQAERCARRLKHRARGWRVPGQIACDRHHHPVGRRWVALAQLLEERGA